MAWDKILINNKLVASYTKPAEARMNAVGIVLTNPRKTCIIVRGTNPSDGRGKTVGLIRFSKVMDRFGREIGPQYVSYPSGKSYAVDFDGSLWTENGKKVGVKKKPKTEYGIKGKLRPFGL